MSCGVAMLLASGRALDPVWGPFLTNGRLSRIPRSLSERLSRRLTRGELNLSDLRVRLQETLEWRWNLRSGISDSEPTLEAMLEQVTRRRRGHIGAAAQIDAVTGFVTHPPLRPQRLELVPDGRPGVPRFRSTPDSVAHYRTAPAHLSRFEPLERIEITEITSTNGTLGQRVASSLGSKLAMSDGYNQLTTPLRVQSVPIPARGTIILEVGSAMGTVDRALADQVNDLFLRTDLRHPQFGLQRFLIHQGSAWHGAIRTGAETFEVRSY